VLLKAKKENKLMVEEGVLNNPKVDVIFRLHNAQTVGKNKISPKGTMAASDWFT
jgi:hypothetical protein